MNDILPFRFRDARFRVVMIDDDPWWVAPDLCAILGLTNVTMALRKLDADMVALNLIEGEFRGKPVNIVSESGMWMLVLRSDKPEAEELRRFLSREVLPSLRRTGSYAMEPEQPVADAPLAEIDTSRFTAALSAVSLMRKLRGNAAALMLWDHLGLPRPDLPGDDRADDLAQRVMLWSHGRSGFTNDELAAGLGLGAPDYQMRRRLGDILRLIGFEHRKVRRGRHAIVNGWIAAATELAA